MIYNHINTAKIALRQVYIIIVVVNNVESVDL